MRGGDMGQTRTGKNSGARNGRVMMHLDMDAFFVNVELLENPRALIRYQDGSASGLMVASRVGDFQLSVPHLSEFDDPMKVGIEHLRHILIFLKSIRISIYSF